jgi:hypothetical protein
VSHQQLILTDNKKKDYGYDAMGKTAVLDDGDERFVV